MGGLKKKAKKTKKKRRKDSKVYKEMRKQLHDAWLLFRARLKNAKNPEHMTVWDNEDEIKAMLRKNPTHFESYPQLQVNYPKVFGEKCFHIKCKDPMLEYDAYIRTKAQLSPERIA